jgi:hypothetical protein
MGAFLGYGACRTDLGVEDLRDKGSRRFRVLIQRVIQRAAPSYRSVIDNLVRAERTCSCSTTKRSLVIIYEISQMASIAMAELRKH